MYNKLVRKKIVFNRYSFKKGYYQVPYGKEAECRNRIIDELGICGRAYFSLLLNRGIRDISLYKYETITRILNDYGITDIWDITPEDDTVDSKGDANS